jgi:hypothetical protein
VCISDAIQIDRPLQYDDQYAVPIIVTRLNYVYFRVLVIYTLFQCTLYQISLSTTLFKQQNICYIYQPKCRLKIITTILLDSWRGVPPRPFMLVLL